MTPKQKEQYGELTKSERKIYDSIMRSFPATHPDSAYDKAIEGGCNFQFVTK